MLTEAHLAGLEEALEYGGGTHALADVLASVRRGTAQLWVEGDAVLVTEINCAPREKELHFWLASGTLDSCIALSNKVMDWGRAQGCTVATLSGRRGWIKALAPEGWEPHTVVMARRL
jgi:hypothetical protein